MLEHLKNALTALSLTICVLTLSLLIWAAYSETGANWLNALAIPMAGIMVIYSVGYFIFGVLNGIEAIRQREIRFSLRTLLIATTLAAVAMGVIVALS